MNNKIGFVSVKVLLTVILSLVANRAMGYYFMVDGIYYNVISMENKTVEVTCGNTSTQLSVASFANPFHDAAKYEYMAWVGNSYSGVVSVPATVSSDVYPGVEFEVTRVGEGAFYKCTSLTTISLPASIESIAVGAFHGCNTLKEVIIPDGVRGIGAFAFAECTALADVSLPSSCTMIFDNAFVHAGANTNELQVRGLDNVQIVGKNAFANSAIRHLPAFRSISYIDRDAFANTEIEELEIQSVELDGLVSEFPISPNAFADCSELKRIVLPVLDMPNIDEIFNACLNIEYIQIATPNPPALFSDWASRLSENCVLAVPESSLQAYQEAPFWSKFSNVIAIEPTSIDEVSFDSIQVKSHRGAIEICGTDNVSIADVYGHVIYRGVATWLKVPAGIYIINSGNKTIKILVY